MKSKEIEFDIWDDVQASVEADFISILSDLDKVKEEWNETNKLKMRHELIWISLKVDKLKNSVKQILSQA